MPTPPETITLTPASAPGAPSTITKSAASAPSAPDTIAKSAATADGAPQIMPEINQGYVIGGAISPDANGQVLPVAGFSAWSSNGTGEAYPVGTWVDIGVADDKWVIEVFIDAVSAGSWESDQTIEETITPDQVIDWIPNGGETGTVYVESTSFPAPPSTITRSVASAPSAPSTISKSAASAPSAPATITLTAASQPAAPGTVTP